MRESANYDRQVIDHSGVITVLNPVEVIGLGRSLRGIYLRRLAVIASVQVRIGRNGREFTLRQGEGIESWATGPALSSGVYVSQAVAGGAGAESEWVAVGDDQEGDVRGPAFRVVNP